MAHRACLYFVGVCKICGIFLNSSCDIRTKVFRGVGDGNATFSGGTARIFIID